ncbi:MAG: NPCBM/NEW2 domain-containing protein [Phycisphaerales bacterium]|nr:NPCBM/NEW2 domain-containing protein [Phycisphaerales bacterium]
MSLILPFVCFLLLDRATANEEPLRLRVGLFDARTLDVELIEITSQGRVRYRLKDREAEIALDDVLRISPQRKVLSRGRRISSDADTFYLADGGVLHGRMRTGRSNAPRVLQVDIGWEKPVPIPFAALAAVRTASMESPEVEREFQRRIADRKPGRDTMIIAKDGKAVVVPGSLERLEPEGWEFRFGSRTRSDRLDKVYGFVLSAPSVEPRERPANVLLNDGDRFTAQILSADESGLDVDAGPLGRLTLPWAWIRTIDLRSDRMVYLSDMEPLKIEQDSMTGASWPPQRDKNVTGGSIRLGRRIYEKGIGVHADTTLTYKLDGQFERFSAVVGIDHSVGAYGSVVFRVRTDDKIRYESQLVRGGEAPRTVSVDVTGAKMLTLECDMARELDLSDHADWANALLIRTKGKENPGGGV